MFCEHCNSKKDFSPSASSVANSFFHHSLKISFRRIFPNFTAPTSEVKEVCQNAHLFFYAQSPDFHKQGLCYYLKILYL